MNPIDLKQYESEERKIRHDFSEDESNMLREDFSQNRLLYADEEKAIVAMRKDWKKRLDEIDAEGNRLLGLIRDRYRDDDRVVRLVPNYDAGLMEMYDENSGELVESRKLRPAERQTNILHAIKVA